MIKKQWKSQVKLLATIGSASLPVIISGKGTNTIETRKVVRNMMGLYKDVTPDKPNSFTHVIFDYEAYLTTLDEIECLKSKIRSLQEEITEEQNKFEELKNKANRIIREIKEQHQEEIEEYQEYIDRNEVLERTNKELGQIVKDRANAFRKIPNKKKHYGYLLLGMESAVYSFKDPYKMRHLPCWKVKLQTPYVMTVSLDTIKEMTDLDLERKLKDKLSITQIFYEGELENMLGPQLDMILKQHEDSEKKEDEEEKEKGVLLFKTSYKLNGLKGFWELELFTSDPITLCPEILSLMSD